MVHGSNCAYIYMKGDKSNPSNYKGITLTSSMSKLMTYLLNERLYFSGWIIISSRLNINLLISQGIVPLMLCMSCKVLLRKIHQSHFALLSTSPNHFIKSLGLFFITSLSNVVSGAWCCK